MSTGVTEPRGPGLPMQKLSPNVYLFHPVPPAAGQPTRLESRASHDPALVILFGWMNATSKGALAEYVKQYQSLYPTSSILLVTCTLAGMTLPWLGAKEARVVATAAHAILAQDDQAPPQTSTATRRKVYPKPRLLLHVFSNAGSIMLYHLYTAYAERANDGRPFSATGGEVTLPPHVTIFDSCPAPFTYRTLRQGIIDGVGPSAVNRLVIAPIAYIYVALVWILVTVLRLPDHTGDVVRLAHNDPSIVGDEVLRLYMYSNADRIAAWTGVEAHARRAEARGFTVRREVFEWSGHVEHARIHPDRYWNVVCMSWEDAQRM